MEQLLTTKTKLMIEIMLILMHNNEHLYILQVGNSALFTACEKGYFEIVKMLLTFGAQVNLLTCVRFTISIGCFLR